MGMTLKSKHRSSIQELERKISEGWMPEDDKELLDVASEIAVLHAPRHIAGLAKLLIENPCELGSPEVVDALYNNLFDTLKVGVVERFKELESDIEKAREEYEAGQYRRPPSKEKVEK